MWGSSFLLLGWKKTSPGFWGPAFPQVRSSGSGAVLGTGWGRGSGCGRHSIPAGMVLPALGWEDEIPLSRVFALLQSPGHVHGKFLLRRARSPRANLGLFSNFPLKNWAVFQIEQGPFPSEYGLGFGLFSKKKGIFASKTCQKIVFSRLFFLHKNCSFIEIGGRRE